ncbi:MAG: SIR2 family protein, partial [Spirochaetales bacterium]|nr:SIR2 family protein [Spirochaetales bacterium]
GSLGWHFDDENKKVWRKDSDSEELLIYPSSLKYSESKKQPYTALMDRLTNFLKQPDTVLITCGYSFSDEHINERIVTALNTNTSGHVISLFYDIDWNDNKKDYLLTKGSELTKLAKANKKLSVYGCRNAVIGGQYGHWKLKREPDKDDTINIHLYYDEDFYDLENELKKEKKGEEDWSGEGELFLPDFLKFVIFLQSMILEDKLFGENKSE